MRRTFFKIYCTYFSENLLNSIFIVLKRTSIIQNCISRRLNSISNHQNQNSTHPKGASGELNRTSRHQNRTSGELNLNSDHQNQISHALLLAYSTLNRIQHHLKASYCGLLISYMKQKVFSRQTHQIFDNNHQPGKVFLDNFLLHKPMLL